MSNDLKLDPLYILQARKSHLGPSMTIMIFRVYASMGTNMLNNKILARFKPEI